MVDTYREAVHAHPTWVRGVRRAAEIILTEHGVAYTEGARWADTDALQVVEITLKIRNLPLKIRNSSIEMMHFLSKMSNDSF